MATQREVSRYASQSAFIFTGKVVKLKAATIANINTDDTAIVAVDHVVTAPEVFSAITGAEITVRFKNLSDVTQGSTLTIYANGWIYGSGMAVEAVGFHEEAAKREMALMVQKSHSSDKDSVLKARLNSAQVGVVGTVTSVQQRDIATTHISEHDPGWHEATIKVDEVVKGDKGAKEVTVLFPNSDDVRWHKVPKFREGQKGIWLLHKAEEQDPKGIAPKVFAALPTVGGGALTAVHAADFLPLEELGRVKALVGQK